MEKENQENSDMEVVLLMHKKIEIQNRLFCIEFKETSLVQFMQISHNDSSILLPSHGISSFMDVINCLCSGFGKQKQQQNRGFSKKKELKIDDKVFYFEIGQGNKERGDYYLKISEASASRNNASIIVPSGNSSNNGWELFKKTIAEINKTSSHLFPPLQSHGNCDPAEFSADAKAEPVASVNDQNSSVSRTNVKPSKNKKSSTGKSKMIRAGFKTFYSDPGSNKKSSTVESKMIRTGFKTFYFEPGSNKFGDFIKISSVTGASRTSISVPRSSMQQFHEMVGHFLNSIDDDESQN